MARVPSAKSKAEETLALHIRTSAVLPTPERELRFHPTRQWRFDFAFPDVKLAVEVEGLVGSANKGRHQTAGGSRQDMEKYEAALLEGWTVYRCHQGMVFSGRALQTIESVYTTLLEQRRPAT
jgi:very-short-patch-repair endonuclease